MIRRKNDLGKWVSKNMAFEFKDETEHGDIVGFSEVLIGIS
jgi:hypothetical protein